MTDEYWAYKDYQSNLEFLKAISPGHQITLGDLEAKVIAEDSLIGISNVMIETVENMGYNFIGCSVMPSVCGKYAGKVNAIFTRKRDYKIPKNPRSKD